MLKITSVKTDRRLRLVLEGKLASPWVKELTKEWNHVRASAQEMTIVVDLKNVTMIGEEGEQILLRMMSEGARFVCRGILNRYVLRRVEQKHLRATSLNRDLTNTRDSTE